MCALERVWDGVACLHTSAMALGRPELAPRAAQDLGCKGSGPGRVQSVWLAQAPPPGMALTVHGAFPQDPLLQVQEVLNGTEVNLQHLTALVDCRSLHLVRLGDAGRGGGCGRPWGLLTPPVSPLPASAPCAVPRTTCRR